MESKRYNGTYLKKIASNDEVNNYSFILDIVTIVHCTRMYQNNINLLLILLWIKVWRLKSKTIVNKDSDVNNYFTSMNNCLFGIIFS